MLKHIQPSPLDLWATAETLKMAQDERRRSRVVLNRVPPRSRLTEVIATDRAGACIPIAATRIGNRVALAQAMALGLGLIENARMTSAAAEISALAEEIRGRALRVNPSFGRSSFSTANPRCVRDPGRSWRGNCRAWGRHPFLASSDAKAGF